jgi:hypothetical protein
VRGRGLRIQRRRATPDYPVDMTDKVWTAAEIETLSPADQDQLFNASIVTDLDAVPAEFLARVRARIADRTAGVESPNQR